MAINDEQVTQDFIRHVTECSICQNLEWVSRFVGLDSYEKVELQFDHFSGRKQFFTVNIDHTEGVKHDEHR